MLTKDADRVQRETLQKIMEENWIIEYLKNWGLNGRTDAESFRAFVPLVTHKDLEPYIQRIIDGDAHPILTGKSITTISLSSGTTHGKPKFVLFTDELMESTMQIYETSFAFRNREFPIGNGKALQFIYSSKQFKTKGCLAAGTATTNVFSSALFKNTMKAMNTPCCSPDKVGMDRTELNNKWRTRSLNSTIGVYGGERVHEGYSTPIRPQIFSERSSPGAKDLYPARRDIGRFNECRITAESIKGLSESDLANAKEAVRDLTSRIEESNSKAKTQMPELENPRKSERNEEVCTMTVGNIESCQYAEVMRELEYVKEEISRLKLDMASVLEDKHLAEKETEAANSKMGKLSSTAEAIKKEISEVDEEQVLTELARIEAVKEFEAIEDQRKEEVQQFSSAVENTKKKINDVLQEIDRSKVLETKLAVVTHEVNMLENELKMVKEMDKRAQRSESLRHPDVGFHKGKAMDSPVRLESVMEELETAKKELASIKEEGFQFTASMDIIKNKLNHVTEEAIQLKRTEEKADLEVQNLNSKLLRGKAKLEAVSAAEEKAKSIMSNLSLTLEQLRIEAEAVKKERDLICEDTTKIKAEVEKTESEIDLAEERLHAAMEELEAVKSSESTALGNLESLIGETMRGRASASQYSSTITISKFEYEYLTRRAVGAEAIADKKVAAAQAWIEALKASEKEILMKTEMAQRKIRELKVEERKETYRTEKLLSTKRGVVEVEEEEKNTESRNLQLQVALPTRPMKEQGYSTPARRTRMRKSASAGVRHMSRSDSVTSRRKKSIPKCR